MYGSKNGAQHWTCFWVKNWNHEVVAQSCWNVEVIATVLARKWTFGLRNFRDRKQKAIFLENQTEDHWNFYLFFSPRNYTNPQMTLVISLISVILILGLFYFNTNMHCLVRIGNNVVESVFKISELKIHLASAKRNRNLASTKLAQAF